MSVCVCEEVSERRLILHIIIDVYSESKRELTHLPDMPMSFRETSMPQVQFVTIPSDFLCVMGLYDI